MVQTNSTDAGPDSPIPQLLSLRVLVLEQFRSQPLLAALLLGTLVLEVLLALLLPWLEASVRAGVTVFLCVMLGIQLLTVVIVFAVSSIRQNRVEQLSEPSIPEKGMLVKVGRDKEAARDQHYIDTAEVKRFVGSVATIVEVDHGLRAVKLSVDGCANWFAFEWIYRVSKEFE